MKNLYRLNILRNEFLFFLKELELDEITHFEYEERFLDDDIDLSDMGNYSITCKFDINTLNKTVINNLINNDLLKNESIISEKLKYYNKDKFCICFKIVGSGALLFGAWFEPENNLLSFLVHPDVDYCTKFQYKKSDMKYGLIFKIDRFSENYESIINKFRLYNVHLFKSNNEMINLINRNFKVILESLYMNMDSDSISIINKIVLDCDNNFEIDYLCKNNKVYNLKLKLDNDRASAIHGKVVSSYL